MNKLPLISAFCGVISISLSSASSAALIDRGGGFIYDDVLDITWLQDAVGSGLADRTTQLAWANNLITVDALRSVSWTDWRLASLAEYQYMYNNNGVSDINPGLFQTVGLWYWSSDPCVNTAFGMECTGLNFGNGSTLSTAQGNNYYGWAVRAGDVGAVPVPAAVWLFGSGLLGLVGVARKKKAA